MLPVTLHIHDVVDNVRNARKQRKKRETQRRPFIGENTVVVVQREEKAREKQ